MQKIFLSYRRNDTAADTNALFQSLTARFGPDSVFKDVDNIPLGANFHDAIREAVKNSAVVLVVIGPSWLDENRSRSANDPVRIEIETALELRVTVIPVLVRSARMPEPDDLPASCRVLTSLNAAALDHDRWGRDTAPLFAAIDSLITQKVGAREAERRRAEVAALEERVRDAVDAGELDDAEALVAELSESVADAGVAEELGVLLNGAREAERRRAEVAALEERISAAIEADDLQEAKLLFQRLELGSIAVLRRAALKRRLNHAESRLELRQLRERAAKQRQRRRQQWSGALRLGIVLCMAASLLSLAVAASGDEVGVVRQEAACEAVEGDEEGQCWPDVMIPELWSSTPSARWAIFVSFAVQSALLWLGLRAKDQMRIVYSVCLLFMVIAQAVLWTAPYRWLSDRANSYVSAGRIDHFDIHASSFLIAIGFALAAAGLAAVLFVTLVFVDRSIATNQRR